MVQLWSPIYSIMHPRRGRALQKSDLYLAERGINAARVVLLERCHIHAAVSFLFFSEQMCPINNTSPYGPLQRERERGAGVPAHTHV